MALAVLLPRGTNAAQEATGDVLGGIMGRDLLLEDDPQALCDLLRDYLKGDMPRERQPGQMFEVRLPGRNHPIVFLGTIHWCFPDSYVDLRVSKLLEMGIRDFFFELGKDECEQVVRRIKREMLETLIFSGLQKRDADVNWHGLETLEDQRQQIH